MSGTEHPMSLIEDLNNVKTRKPSLPEWLISRDPKERAAFEAAVSDVNVPVDSLVQIVRRHGGKTTPKSIEAMRASRVAR